MTKRLTLLFAFILLVPVPAHAQANLKSDVAAARAKYPTPMSAAQQAAVVNEVAWTHRAEGWGLLSKPSGNNCPQPTSGQAVACDILFHLPSGHHFDVLISAETDATPDWNDKGEMDRNRFVVPIDPGGSSSGVVIDPPTSEAATAELQKQQLALLLQIVAKLQEQLDAQAKQSAEQTAALSAAIRDLKAEIAKGIRVRF